MTYSSKFDNTLLFILRILQMCKIGLVVCYLGFSMVNLGGVLLVEENPLSLSEESPYRRESQSLSGLQKNKQQLSNIQFLGGRFRI